jgi:hypothetical protein
VKKIIAVIGGAVWRIASLWNCWGCEFFLPEASQERQWCLLVETVRHKEEERFAEGGRCQFCKKICLSIADDILHLANIRSFETPCEKKVFDLSEASFKPKLSH